MSEQHCIFMCMFVKIKAAARAGKPHCPLVKPCWPKNFFWLYFVCLKLLLFYELRHKHAKD